MRQAAGLSQFVVLTECRALVPTWFSSRVSIVHIPKASVFLMVVDAISIFLTL